MSTRPHHDYASIAQDATQLSAVARADVHDKTFSKYIDSHELAAFDANIAKLKTGAAGRTDTLETQVAAGVHVAKICASIAAACRATRDAAELELMSDPATKNEAVARAFGMGHTLDASSVSSVESFAHVLLAGAQNHPKEASKVHLDTKGVHHLRDLVAALEGADVAHVATKANRHDASTSLDSLAHLVAAEAAHIRFVATRVFRGDEAKLARYASTLPRHQVVHRTRHAPAPSAPSTPAAT